jgi:hypothetical protein
MSPTMQAGTFHNQLDVLLFFERSRRKDHY